MFIYVKEVSTKSHIILVIIKLYLQLFPFKRHSIYTLLHEKNRTLKKIVKFG